MPWNGWVRERGEERENILPNMPLYFYVIFAEWGENYIKIKEIKKRKRKKKEEEDEGTNKIEISPSFLHKRAHFNKISLPKGEFFFFFFK